MLIHHEQYSFGRVWFAVPGKRFAFFPGKGVAKRFGWKWVSPDRYHNCWLHGS